MDSKIDVMPSAKNQYIAAVVMNIIVFCHGCSIGWVSPSLALLSGPDTPLDEPLTPDQAALVGSLICVGAIPFTSMFGWIADRNGRKTAAIACAFPYLACWLMKLLWRTATGLMVARFLGGVAASGLFMLSPLYGSEVASVHTRGALSSLMVFSVNIGIVFMYVLGAYASYTTVLAVMIPLPVIFVLLMSRMPETPSFLVKKNRFEEAAKALSWLRGLPVDCGIIKKELDSLKSEVELAKNTAVDSHFIVNNQRNAFSTMSYGALKYPILNRETINQDFANYSASDDMGNAASGLENVPSWKIFISSVPTRRAFAVICTLLTIQCFMGLFAVITYSNDIFARAGSSLSPSTSSIIVGLLQFFGSVVASSLIEKLGRKVLLTSSCLAVSLSMAAMGTYFFLSDSGMDVSSISWIPVLALSVAVSTFAMGAGPVPYCLTSEVFMIQTRGIATSILLTWVWVASFIIAQFFGSAVTLVGIGSVFWFFALAGFGGIIVTIFFLPETKGRTMNEILEYFENDKSRKIAGKLSETGELL